MTATMLTYLDELYLDDFDEPAEVSMAGPETRPDAPGIVGCTCLLTAVGRCPTQLRAAPS
jgi:hypothetical protein